MTNIPHINLLAMKTKLSTLWIVVLFNMLFRDIHEFARTGYLEEMLAMTSNGAQIPEGFLLAAAVVLEIPILMIFLTQVLNVKVNRWVNLIAAVFMIVAIVSNNLAPDLDDLFYVAFECVALLLVIWYAWRWSND
jgi:Sec-independent protein secretion pathway component TatC